MSSLPVHHPENGLLLRYIDGELPGRKSRQVQKHLQACWECRTEVDELHETVAECVRYRKNVLAAHLPPPPNIWSDLHRGFDRIDAAAEARPSMVWLSTAPWKWAVTAVAAVLAVFGVFYELRETPSVQAAALLQRAVAAASTRAPQSPRIRIRTKNGDITRRAIAISAGVAPATDRAIHELFQAAHYDWKNPLSANAFQAWRSQLTDKTDEVAKIQDCYRIRTSTSQGELAAATITLREVDLEPVEGRLEFRNRDWLEFSWVNFNELTEPAAPESGVTAGSKAEAPERPLVPSRAAADAPGPTASISDELQVLAALHKIGADLGDPVDVTLSGNRVLVSGVGVPAQRQRQIHSMLDTMPNVAVQFAEPRPATLPPDSAPPQPGPDAAANAHIQTRLEAELGGRAEFERFSSQVLDWNDEAMARVYALRRLAQAFPAGSEIGMTANGRAILHRIAREHMTALAGLTGNMQRVLTPALVGVGGSAKGLGPGPEAAAWQPAAEHLFQAARRVEKLLSALSGVASGVTAGEITAAGLPSDLLTTLNEERAYLEECKRLL